MKLLIQNGITYLLAQLAAVLTPALQRRIVRLCLHIVGDVPQLATGWVITFKNPTRRGRPKKTVIDATLRQYGRIIRGFGHVQGKPGDPFEYRGIIRRNVLYGTFQRIDSHILAGTGTFVVKIKPDSQAMEGHCTWYDNELDDVWSSVYMWTRHE